MDLSADRTARVRLPIAVALLGGAIFAVTTAEFAVSGLLDALAHDLRATIAQVGYLVSIYAAGMMVGGPLMMIALARLRQTTALALVLGLFALAQLAAAFAPGYLWLAISRFVQGFAGAASFGLALTIGGHIAGPARQGESAAWIMGGAMIGTVLGLPMATWLGGLFGWRPVFVGLAVVAALAALLAGTRVPATTQAGRLRQAGAMLGDFGLWKVFATSFLVIGATFAAFTYFVPLLGQRAGVAPAWIPACLTLYGMATVIGNFACGRLVDRYGPWRVQWWGLAIMFAALLLFALGARRLSLVLPALLLLGLTGVALNPAMVARVMARDSSPLVASLHTAVISAGLLAGAALGGLAIERSGELTDALWVALALAGLGWLSLRAAPDRDADAGLLADVER